MENWVRSFSITIFVTISYHYLLTYLLTPLSRVLLEKLTGSSASQEIPRIFGTRRFITVLTSARHLSLSWANSIQFPQPPPTSWKSILILSSHLRLDLPSGLFPPGFPTRILCTPLPSPIRATCPAHLMYHKICYEIIRTWDKNKFCFTKINASHFFLGGGGLLTIAAHQLHTIPTTWKPKHQIPQAATSCIILSSSWWWA